MKKRYIFILGIFSLFILTFINIDNSYARVWFIEKKETTSTVGNQKPCQLSGYTYTAKQCTTQGKLLKDLCPTDPAYGKTCACDAKFKYDATNCTDNRTVSGESCGGKYEGCGCNTTTYKWNNSSCASPAELTGKLCNKTIEGGPNYGIPGKLYDTCSCPAGYDVCSSDQVGVGTVCNSGDGKQRYTSCQCNTTFMKCDNGGDAGAKSCTDTQGTKYTSCKKEVKCDAPYYVKDGACVLWDGAVAVAKTCSDLVTISKNANITGNVLIWGALTCGETQITLPVGQNLVGRNFFNGKYSEATDTNQDKFSKITWDFQTTTGFGIAVEHNTTLSDLTLSIKSNQPSKWIDWVSFNATPGLILVNTKQNLIFKNLDLVADVSSVTGMGVNLIEGNSALSGSFTFQGNNYMTLKNKKTTNSDGYSYQANTSTYFTKLVNMNVGQDAKLNITGIDGGAYYGVFHTKTNVTKNGQIYFKQTNPTDDIAGFKDYTLSDIPICSVILKDTARIDFDFSGIGYPFYLCPFEMYNNSVMNANAGSAQYSSVGITYAKCIMSNNAVYNFKSTSGKPYDLIGSATLTLNDNAIFRAYASGSKNRDVFDYTTVIMNGSSKMVVKIENCIKEHQSYCGWWGRGLTMNGSSKFFWQNNQDMFTYIDFKLNSTSARVYARETNSSSPSVGAIFGNRSYSGFDSVITSVSGAQFYLEATGQTSINGVYTMPAVSGSKISSAYDCQYKGAAADKCYSNTMITYLGATKSSTMTTTYKSEFDQEISNLTANLPSY
ncbi:MAG: hypothetical protein ACK5N8_06375 [Alphaproteobacteria bacterium]